MRLIDADRLYEKTAEWEAEALAQVERYVTDEENVSEWRRWTAILNERTAFRHDVADAPTVDTILVRCRDCDNTDIPVDEEDDHDYWCMKHGSYVYEDDFCSYGERRHK